MISKIQINQFKDYILLKNVRYQMPADRFNEHEIIYIESLLNTLTEKFKTSSIKLKPKFEKAITENVGFDEIYNEFKIDTTLKKSDISKIETELFKKPGFNIAEVNISKIKEFDLNEPLYHNMYKTTYYDLFKLLLFHFVFLDELLECVLISTFINSIVSNKHTIVLLTEYFNKLSIYSNNMYFHYIVVGYKHDNLAKCLSRYSKCIKNINKLGDEFLKKITDIRDNHCAHIDIDYILNENILRKKSNKTYIDTNINFYQDILNSGIFTSIPQLINHMMEASDIVIEILKYNNKK